MRAVLCLGLAALALVVSAVRDPAFAYDASQRASLQRMVEYAEQERWTSALSASQRAGGRAARDAYEWLRLRHEEPPSFQRVASWVSTHPGWPSQNRIQANGERLLREEPAPAAEVARFFDAHPPITGAGAMAYIGALRKLGAPNRARAVALRSWVAEDFNADEEKRLVARYGEPLSKLQEKRLDHLIWNSRLTAAERQLGRVSRGVAALGRARIALMRHERGVDRLVKAVPQAYRNHPGLAYARMYWRYKQGLRDGAEEMMLAASRADNLGRPVKWADERGLFVREALDDGRARRAYDLAAGHGLERGAAYAGLEWLAGWIALRSLKRPDLAYRHFSELYGSVSTPVSLARAGFWAGEAAQAMGRKKEAAEWRARAADHPDAFYGQRAALKLGRKLAQPPVVPAKPGPCLDDPRVAVGEALVRGGAQTLARRFFYDAAEECASPREVKAMGERLLAMGATRVAVGLGRVQRRGNVLLPEIAYPLERLPAKGCTDAGPPERALALALARQESGFDATAKSHAGARGLMQVMPGTAKRTAAAAGLRYDLGRLGSDGNYNARIGQCYLTRMLARFDDAYPLAIAAYNAGPSRVRRWLENHGALTEKNEIDWIERIPFSETRNYVQRVLESLAIYRLRLDE